MAGTIYLADTSVYVLRQRHPVVRDRFAALATRSQHRKFPLPDLTIAATAEQHGATVLHYDADFDRIAAVTGQPAEWVADRGSR
jgi:predicted nucleic acid-binding protein